MTREQEIKEMAKIKASHITSDKDMQVAFADALRSGAVWADRSMITKVCEWLRNNWHKYINIDADGVVCFGHWEKDFRKAMKGE